MVIVETPQIRRYGLQFSIELRDLDIESRYASSIAVKGWVACESALPVRIFFYSGPSELSAQAMWILGDAAVQDIRSQYPSAAICRGFATRFSSLSIDQDIEVFVELEVDGNLQRIQAATLRDPPRPRLDLAYRERWTPLLMPALGRSGTTMLMALLSAHPEIVVPGGYPFEFRQASYLWHAARVLAAPANAERSMHPDSFETQNPYGVGYPPYTSRAFTHALGIEDVVRWQDEQWPASVIDFIKAETDRYVDIVAGHASKPRARFLAEKVVVSSLVPFVRRIYAGTRELYLVRDFRDVFVSARAFNLRRGASSFGRDGFPDDLAWLRSFRSAAQAIHQIAYTAQAGRGMLVRYEDVMVDTAGAVKRLCSFLGICDDDRLVRKICGSLSSQLTESSQHVTSGSAASSIGRWRSDMSEEEKSVAIEAFGEYLTAFGYPLR